MTEAAEPRPPAPPQAAPRAPGAHPARRWLLAAAALMLVLVVGTAGLALWLLRTPSGTAELLARLPIVEITGPRGALLGSTFGADRMKLALPGGGTLLIEGLDLGGIRWRGWIGAGLWARLQADTLTARRIVVQTGPPSAEPATAPASLRLPLEVQIARVQVGELQVDTMPPVRTISANVHLGRDGGAHHRIEQLQFDRDRVRVAGAHLAIDADAPFALDAALQAQALAGTQWQASLKARGPLEAMDVQVTLRGEPTAGRQAPALDAKAQVRPFATWPLGTVAASTRALDLAALASGLPSTLIDGQVELRSAGTREPVSADITLTNQLPGRWNDGRVPLQRARLSVRGNPAEPQRIEVPSFDLEFADAQAAAGRWQGQGRWDGSTATIDARLTALRPQRLDARAPAMRLDGPLALVLRGLPSPDASAAPAPASAAASGAPAPAAVARFDALEADLRGTLDGMLDGAPQAVTLAFDGTASSRRVVLRKLRAKSGAASAEATAQAQRGAGGRWQLRSTGRLDRFDPLPWFPGIDGAPWRRGPHRLSAGWTLDLALPDTALRQPPLQWLQTLQGNGELRVADSLLAGVPLDGVWTLQHEPAAPAAQRSHVHGEMRVGGNRVVVDGRGDPNGPGDTDRWQLQLAADTLATLAPLAALDPSLAAWAPRKGSLQATLSADGRWPVVRSEGQATALAVQAGPLQLARAQARWRVGTGAGQPLDLQADATQIAWGTQRVATASASVRGTVAAHHLVLDAAVPGRPPEVLERMFALRTGSGTQLQLEGDGAWAGAAAGGGTWRGQLQRLNAGVWDGGAERRADASWIDARDLRLELRFGADGELDDLTAPSGRATLAGGVVLRWNDVRWQPGAQAPALVLQAQVEPVAVAPYLQRAQRAAPGGLQWSGDLRMGATIDVRAGERFDADIALRREGGDLQISDGGAPQPLGLSDADITLAAHDGVWRFAPRLNGRMLGQLSGAVTVRTTPQRRWPGSDAALEGTVQIQVPSLAVWAGWAPPGWRLEGELATSARLGGTFGAPEYTGELRAARVGVRNLLQGVALSDGELVVALNGDSAQIQRLSVRGGDGTLSATGGASFGSAPQARLEVTADRFRVLGRVDRQLVLSGQAAMVLQPERLALNGKLAVDSGLFDLTGRDAPTLDDDVTINHEGPAAAARPEAAPVSPLMRNANVALDVDLGNKLRLRGRGLDTTLAGTLKVSTPGGRLAVNGTVRSERGTYAAYGQKLEIERGIVVFAGPLDSARLDILALRPNLDMRVGVSIAGTALNPRVRLISEPEMSETDKLSWLVLGRGPDGLGRTDTALLQRAALALLAGEGEGPTDGLIRAIGLDDISVRQTDGEVRETVITLGKQLSRRWYVGYERGVNATTGTWQLVYRIAQRFTLRAQSGQENSLDLIWTWRFDKLPL